MLLHTIHGLLGAGVGPGSWSSRYCSITAKLFLSNQGGISPQNWIAWHNQVPHVHKTLNGVNLSRSVIIPQGPRRWFNQTRSGESFDTSRGRTLKNYRHENETIWLYLNYILSNYNIIYQYAKILDIEHDVWSTSPASPSQMVAEKNPSLRLVKWRHASMDSDALANGASERPRHWASWQRLRQALNPWAFTHGVFWGGGNMWQK